MKIPKTKIFNGKKYTLRSTNISKQPQTMNARLDRYQNREDARVVYINGQYALYFRKRSR